MKKPNLTRLAAQESLLPHRTVPTTLAQNRGMQARALGYIAEDHALAYLEKQGLQLIARNVKFKLGELDLIMWQENAENHAETCLVFVEIKTRVSEVFGGAMASIDATKKRRMQAAAQLFLQQWQANTGALPAARFDMVSVAQAGGGLYCCEWLKDVALAA